MLEVMLPCQLREEKLPFVKVINLEIENPKREYKEYADYTGNYQGFHMVNVVLQMLF